MLLLIVLPLVVYRISGGEPLLWFKYHNSHSNSNTRLLYIPAERRAKMQEDLEMHKAAMDKAIKARGSRLSGLLYMIPDHEAFKKGSVKEPSSSESTYPGIETSSTSTALLPFDLQADAPPDSAAGPSRAPQSGAVPAQPSIDSELDADFKEPAQDRERRLEWIRFYVRENNLQKAFDLGWDGKPFKIASSASLASGAEPSAAMSSSTASAPPQVTPLSVGSTSAEAEAPAAAEGTSALHRI